ncbi:MAG: DNA cytosine methyltransferase [Oscillospiraceae bacterium]|nr:DNA cytosine methyltransferase [Oscillospiraceae bacterium]
MKSPNPHSGIYEAKTARTLDCNGGNPCCNQGGVVIVQPAYAIGNGQSNQTGTELSDRSGTLNCMHDQQEVIYPTETKFWEAYQHHGYRQSESAGTLTMGQNDHVRGDTPIITQSYGANCRNDTLNEELYPTLQAKESGGQSLNYSGVLLQKIWCWIARRLIPLECGRLQGYPDHWTDIGPWTDDKGKLHKESSDTSQYRAYGNSIAVPCGLRVIGAIAEYERSKKPCLTTLHYRAALPATRN